MISGAIDCGSENVIIEVRIIRHQGSSQVMRKVLQDLKKVVNVFVSVFDHDLERAEQLCRDEVPLLFASEMLDGHLDGCWLVRSVNTWYAMVSEGNATEEELAAVEVEDCIDVCLDLFIVPCDHWTESEVREASLC